MTTATASITEQDVATKRRKSARPAAQETFSCIGAGMRVMGDVHCAGVVRVAGTVIGNVSANSQVLVAQGGRVEGAVQAPEAVLNGNVIGPIVANRVEIQASAVIRGKITTSCFVIHEGAVLDVDVTKPVLADPVVHRDPLNPIQVMASSDEEESASVRQLQGGNNRAVRG